MCVLFVKHKKAYDVRISDWSSYVCSSDHTILDFEPRRRKGAFQGLARCAGIRARCDPNAVFAFIKTAGLDQRGATDTFDRRDRHWPQRKALSHSVGLISADIADAKHRITIA